MVMDEKQKKKIETRFHIAAGVVLALVVVYLLLIMLKKIQFGIAFAFVICGGLLLFWLLETVISPIVCHRFDDRTPEQVSAYKKYAVLEIVGYAGLAWFALTIDRSTGFYGAMVYVVTMMFKRRFYNEYRGITDDEPDDESSEEADTLEGAGAEKPLIGEDAGAEKALTREGAEAEKPLAGEDAGSEKALTGEDAGPEKAEEP